MKKHATLGLTLTLAICSASVFAAQTGGLSGLEVVPKPGARVAPTSGKPFQAWELPFRLPARLKPNAPYESAPFYAVVLRKFEETPCDGHYNESSRSVEGFRKAAQKRFPAAKVFADQQCPDMTAVSYWVDGTAEGMSYGAFVAVYAGKTEAEARAVLAKAKVAYPGAVVKRMRVGYSHISQ
jgi:hypothetical protein